ncbi:MAG: sensor domain-containing diguanylate cyclase, partial [Candidatus Schekmanbacteria bacterium]
SGRGVGVLDPHGDLVDNILKHINDKGESLCLSKCPLSMTIEDGKSREAEVYLHHKKGYRVPVSVKISPFYDEKGNIEGAIEIFGDNSAEINLKEKIRELEELSLNDPLTGIGNRRYLDINLQMRIEEFHRYGWNFGIIMSDIDDFKRINDNYGHDTGDEVLKRVAKTYLNCLRPFDAVGRIGGDEFLSIIKHIDKERLYAISKRFISLIRETAIPLNSKSINISVSVGATMSEIDDTPQSILKRADDLLYESKKNGKNRITIE